MKNTLFNHLKNIQGWRTKRKLVIFSVDDYGNVRVGSKEALVNLEKEGIQPVSHFDKYDTLETREDLEALFEVLSSVKDKNGNPAIFTPYVLSYNINFNAIEKENSEKYIGESITDTFYKLEEEQPKDYKGTWSLWQEGIKKGLIKPQFHGKEHLNLFVFNDLLKKGNKNLITCLRNQSYVEIPEHQSYQQGWTAAYAFDSEDEILNIEENIKEGVQAFNKIYGYESKVFTPPAMQFPNQLENGLINLGIKYIDKPRHTNKHLGNGKYKKEFHKLGDVKPIPKIVRNVVYEPTTKVITNDWLGYTMKQIEIAFFWGKPAHISSHRVNFCGMIDENNRKTGLDNLQQLLKKIIEKWPDVEFISADQLGDIVYQHN